MNKSTIYKYICLFGVVASAILIVLGMHMRYEKYNEVTTVGIEDSEGGVDYTVKVSDEYTEYKSIRTYRVVIYKGENEENELDISIKEIDAKYIIEAIEDFLVNNKYQVKSIITKGDEVYIQVDTSRIVNKYGVGAVIIDDNIEIEAEIKLRESIYSKYNVEIDSIIYSSNAYYYVYIYKE